MHCVLLTPARLLTGWDPLPRAPSPFSGLTGKGGDEQTAERAEVQVLLLTSNTGFWQDPSHSACFFFYNT